MKRDYFFILVLLFWVGLAFQLLDPFLTPILWSIVVSIVVYPFHQHLMRWMPPTWSALLITTSLLVFWIIPILTLSVIVFRQLIEIGTEAITLFRAYHLGEWIATIKNSRLYRDNPEELEPLVRLLQSPEFRNILIDAVNTVITFIGQQFKSIALTAGQNLFNIFVFLITLFFLLLRGERLLHSLERLIPINRADFRAILVTTYRTALAVVYGTIGTAFVQAILIVIAFMIVEITYPLVWGILTFFAAFIPPFGASLIWIPAAVYAFLAIGLEEGIFMALWGALLVSSVDNVVRPLIMKRGVELPYVVLFFATIGGLINFGFVGLFLGPIIFTTLLLLLEIYERRVVAPDPAATLGDSAGERSPQRRDSPTKRS